VDVRLIGPPLRWRVAQVSIGQPCLDRVEDVGYIIQRGRTLGYQSPVHPGEERPVVGLVRGGDAPLDYGELVYESDAL
jgi:hypothetical protein